MNQRNRQPDSPIPCEALSFRFSPRLTNRDKPCFEVSLNVRASGQTCEVHLGDSAGQIQDLNELADTLRSGCPEGAQILYDFEGARSTLREVITTLIGLPLGLPIAVNISLENFMMRPNDLALDYARPF